VLGPGLLASLNIHRATETAIQCSHAWPLVSGPLPMLGLVPTTQSGLRCFWTLKKSFLLGHGLRSGPKFAARGLLGTVVTGANPRWALQTSNEAPVQGATHLWTHGHRPGRDVCREPARKRSRRAVSSWAGVTRSEPGTDVSEW